VIFSSKSKSRTTVNTNEEITAVITIIGVIEIRNDNVRISTMKIMAAFKARYIRSAKIPSTVCDTFEFFILVLSSLSKASNR